MAINRPVLVLKIREHLQMKIATLHQRVIAAESLVIMPLVALNQLTQHLCNPTKNYLNLGLSVTHATRKATIRLSAPTKNLNKCIKACIMLIPLNIKRREKFICVPGFNMNPEEI